MDLKKKPLCIRADAGTRIGNGHVMRCLALSQAWQDAGGEVVFAMSREASPLEARVREEKIEVVLLPVPPGSRDDAMQTADLARSKGAGWVVADGYHFGADYQKKIKDSNLKLLFVDDNGHGGHYCADMILNQNAHACEELYRDRQKYTRLLLGGRYALLRREFLKWRGWKRTVPEQAGKILITLGGGDPDNVTLKLIEAVGMLSLKECEARVVVGPSNPHRALLQEAAESSPSHVTLLPPEKDMSELMAWADVSITAGGSTCWETAFMGLPSLVLVLADNQLFVAKKLNEEGVAVSMGWARDLSPEQVTSALERLMKGGKERAVMSMRGMSLIDGSGAKRVVKAIALGGLEFRPVQEQDARLVWSWANDPSARAVSFSSEQIPWEEHVRWFQSKLNDPGCLFFIAETKEGIPIGYVRCDRNGEEQVISVSVDRKFRGIGYGSLMIELGSRKIFEASDIGSIHAYIKQSNDDSVRAFTKAGYSYVGAGTKSGQAAGHYMLRRSSSL